MGEETGTSGPHRAAGYEIGVLLRRAHRKAADAFNEVLRPLDIQGRHFGILLLLHQHGPLSQRQLIDHLGSDKSAMVRSLDDLEARKLCIRKPAAHDRRAHAVALTPTGREVFETAERDARKVSVALLDGFTPAERLQFGQFLTRFIAD
ncbi:MAG TPA: MarR family transcriptional regulator [Pseudonocardiaceae bacterium]|jgi:DNA-binding MarR family transcriptional regulator|nr:MarR family transcriptional regulator [Pseudonocardiaceae bacterium]